MIPVRRALVSVADKTGLEALCRRLHRAGVEIVSTGGTAQALAAAGIPVTEVAEVTGYPEILGGRVKTLHPRVHGGIQADPEDERHRADLDREGIAPFELVVVNLYPFSETVAGGASGAEVVEQIDIGGPAMVRAAAKNHARVGVVVSPDQYDEVAAAVESGGLSFEQRRDLARRAFFHTASYDAAIVGWMEPEGGRIVLPLERVRALRYGENPHQTAAAYTTPGRAAWWAGGRVLQGKEMSYNNLLDAHTAWAHVNDHDRPACVIVKHTNPCGAAVAPDAATALRLAWECDPVSAYGGVVALNRALDPATGEVLLEAGFVEVVVAPDVAEGVDLGGKRNLRVMVAPPPSKSEVELRSVGGGILAQTPDRLALDEEWKVVSERAPTEGEWEDLRFAWVVAAHAKSNAVVVAAGGRAVGVGAGDQSRVGAAERALVRAGDRARGAVAASDGFFPFRDGIDALAAEGVTAVVQPGGSIRDDEVVGAAAEHGMAMVFTGRRHFLH